MSEGGSIKARLAKATKEQEELSKQYMELRMPPPKNAYRMNDDEFMHHCVVLAHERLIKEKLDVSDDEYKLAIMLVWIEEQTKLLEALKIARSEQLRRQLTQGINGIPPTPGL